MFPFNIANSFVADILVPYETNVEQCRNTLLIFPRFDVENI